MQRIIPEIIEAAQNIIDPDPALAWIERPLPNQFIDLIKDKLGKRIQNVNVIGLKILWTLVMRKNAGNPKLATFLYFTTEEALRLMTEQSAIGRNVRSCLRDDNIKRLSLEFVQLL